MPDTRGPKKPLNYTLVDDTKYLQSFTLSPHMMSPTEAATLSLRFQRREFLGKPFNENEDRDSIDMGLSAGYISFFTGDGGFFNLRYELNREVTDGKNWSNRGNKLAASLLYPLTEGLKVQAYFDAGKFTASMSQDAMPYLTLSGSIARDYTATNTWTASISGTYSDMISGGTIAWTGSFSGTDGKGGTVTGTFTNGAWNSGNGGWSADVNGTHPTGTMSGTNSQSGSSGTFTGSGSGTWQ